MKRLLSLLVILLFCGSLMLFNSVYAQNAATALAPAASAPAADGGVTNTVGEFSSALPLILVDTQGQDIGKDYKIFADLSVIDNANGDPSDEQATYQSLGTIKYRGNSSYALFDKRSYRIEFYRSETQNTDYPLFGMDTASEWVLYGPFLDRTLTRNSFFYELARKLSFPWSPDTRYCEVFVDDEYQGVYLAVEPITTGEARIDLLDFGMLSGETPYIIRRERFGQQEMEMETYGYLMGKTSYILSVDYPSSLSLTEQQAEWIIGDVNRFEMALYSDYFDSPEYGYAAYIDVDTFVDYYLLYELAMIDDGSRLSTYTYKNIAGKLTMTVWDFNNALDNMTWSIKPTDQFYVADGNWYARLLQDRAFVQKVVHRYQQLRQGDWSNDSLLALIDAQTAKIGSEAVARNFDLWGYTFDQPLLSFDADGNIRDPRSYEQALAMMKETLVERLEYLDDNLETLYANCVN
jgi:hypothetical protein